MRQRHRLLREQPSRHLRPAGVRHPKPARIRGLRCDLLGADRERRTRVDDTQNPRHRSIVLRLCRARRAVRSRRRDRRAVGGGGLAPVRAGDRAADSSVFSRRLSTDHGRVLPAVQLQSDLSARGRCRPRLDVAVPFRDQPRSGRVDVRKPPIGFALAADARVPLYPDGTATGGIYQWLVVTWPSPLTRFAREAI